MVSEGVPEKRPDIPMSLRITILVTLVVIITTLVWAIHYHESREGTVYSAPQPADGLGGNYYGDKTPTFIWCTPDDYAFWVTNAGTRSAPILNEVERPAKCGDDVVKTWIRKGYDVEISQSPKGDSK